MDAPPTPRWRNAALSLRLLEEADVGAAYVGWLNDPEVNRYLESRFVHHDLESTRRFVRDCRVSAHSLLLGIFSAALGGRHVGNIKIGPIDRHHGLGEIGILIGEPAARGRGLASGAIAALADIAFQELGLRKLTAGCYADNVGSRKAFERAGFRVEGVRRHHFLLDGRPVDLVLMARHRDEPPPTQPD